MIVIPSDHAAPGHTCTYAGNEQFFRHIAYHFTEMTAMYRILFIFSVSLIIRMPAQQLHYPVPGTGVTVCYNNTTVIQCPSDPAAAFYGQYQGIAPSYTANSNGTVTDNITGLTWAKARGVKVTWDSAFVLAAQCRLGGFSDWRVPTIKELYSLINFNGKSGSTAAACIPYLDTSYFEWAAGDIAAGDRVIDAQDWSATKYKGLTMNGDSTIFGVNFVDGRIKGYPQYKPASGSAEKQRMYVRFVRGNGYYGKNEFIDNNDSTISDLATGLMWSKSDSKAGMNWQSALAWVQTKNTANYLGHNDWRLPEAKELQSIIDYTRCRQTTGSAAIDPLFYCTSIIDEAGRTNWPFFWTNTTHKDNYGGVYLAFGEALGWMKIPPTAGYYTLCDVHGAGAQRSDPKSGSYTSYYLGTDQNGNPIYGLGPQGDVIRISNYVRLVRSLPAATGLVKNRPVNAGNYSLLQNYPNPFNPVTTIQCVLPVSSFTTLRVCDISGQLVRVLCNQILPSGTHSFPFNGTGLPSGTYLYELRAGTYHAAGKMQLIK